VPNTFDFAVGAIAGATRSGQVVSRQHHNLGWRASLIYLILLVLAWQSCLLQTHIHPVTSASTPSAQLAGTISNNQQRAPDDPADCPICQASAATGTFMLAAPALLAAPIPTPVWYDATEAVVSFAVRPAHHWRSRAPPLDSIPSI